MLHESTRIGIQGTTELDVISTYGPINDNGYVLQAEYEDGRRKCRPSNGAANKFFCGFSKGIEGRGVPSNISFAEVVTTTTASGGFATARLSHPLSAAGVLAVYKGEGYGTTPFTATANSSTDPSSATQYEVGSDNQTLKFTAANAETDFFVIYRYSPTIENARWIYGDLRPGNNAPNNLGRIGAIFDGEIVTDMFDPNIDWSSVIDTTKVLRGGANGLVTVGTQGCVVPGRVIALPSIDLPFLTLAVGSQP